MVVLPASTPNFYPRPPRGGRPCHLGGFLCCRRISIHALREEGDSVQVVDFVGPFHFYPRPPRGGRRIAHAGCSSSILISIHALREEGDGSCPADSLIWQNFYPRPPRGGRHEIQQQNADDVNFYPRPPRGGRHNSFRFTAIPLTISIHALREEGDAETRTLPRLFRISIHALREEGDLNLSEYVDESWQFLSTPSARRATVIRSHHELLDLFLSTPSARRATSQGCAQSR